MATFEHVSKEHVVSQAVHTALGHLLALSGPPLGYLAGPRTVLRGSSRMSRVRSRRQLLRRDRVRSSEQLLRRDSSDMPEAPQASCGFGCQLPRIAQAPGRDGHAVMVTDAVSAGPDNRLLQRPHGVHGARSCCCQSITTECLNLRLHIKLRTTSAEVTGGIDKLGMRPAAELAQQAGRSAG